MAGITLPAVAAAVAEEIPKIFDDALNRARDGGASTIKDGNPTSIPGKIGQATARSACRRYGANPGSFPANRQVRIEAACRPYLDGLNPGDGPTIGVPFEGGQCAQLYRMNGAVNYEVFIGNTGGTSNPSQTVVTEYSLTGPIGGISFTYDTPGPFGNRRWIMTVGTALGPVIVRSVLNPITTNRVSKAAWAGAFEIVPGQSDDCGNPPPVVTQPRPRVDPTGPSFRFNPSGDIDVDLDVDILPDGTINVDIGTGPINVDLFPPDAGGDGSGGDGSGGDGPPGDVGVADEDAVQETDEDGTASGCGGENQVLGGLKIEVVSVPPKANQYSPGIYRGAAYIWMGVEGNLDQDFGGSMLRSGQFFLPEKNNLTCWEVKANNGFKLRVTPYYKEVPE